MNYKTIAGIIPTIQSANLVNENLKGIPKKDGSGKGARLNKGRGGCDTQSIIGRGMKNIVGTSMIKINADLIAGL